MSTKMPSSNDDHGEAKLNETSTSSPKRQKRRRLERPNEDEMDDVDEYEEENDDSNIPSESQTLDAKRKRRLQRTGDVDGNNNDPSFRTRIDHETSLVDEGIAIEPFHMDAENNDGTGYFDGDTYVFRRTAAQGANDEPDAWLDTLQEQEDELRTTKPNSNEKVAPASKSTSTAVFDEMTKDELYATIFPLVSDSETVSQAIVRYGRLLKSNAAGGGKDLAKQALEDLTSAGSALLLQGEVDIYQKTRNDLGAQQREEKPVAKKNVQWEYMGKQDGKVHGPFTSDQMMGWIKQGYFVGATAVQVRSVSTEPAHTVTKSIKDELISDLLDDDESDGTTLVRGAWMISDRVNFNDYT